MALDILNESDSDKALLSAIKTESAPPEEAAAAASPELQPEKPLEPEVKPLEPAPKPEAVKTVPHQALHEERERRKAAERERDELRRTQQRPEEPDETQDPIGTISALKQRLGQLEQERQQSAAMQDLARRVGTRVNAYAKDHPEYVEQYQFLQQSRLAELRALPGQTDESIARQIAAEEMQLGRMALDNDMEPAEVIANLAKARGWQPKAAPAAPANPLVPDTKAAEAQIERLERGQRAATSPSKSGGAAPVADELSLDQIANLNGAAFDSAWAKFAAREKASGNWR